MPHRLRREAEAQILPNLPAFLRGEYRAPGQRRATSTDRDPVSSRAAAHAAARLFADAFATRNGRRPKTWPSACRIPEPHWRTINRSAAWRKLATECRYPAAQCTALAGCGRRRGWGQARRGGADGDRVEQAHDWLRADLAVWAGTLDGGSRAARVLIRKMFALGG